MHRHHRIGVLILFSESVQEMGVLRSDSILRRKQYQADKTMSTVLPAGGKPMSVLITAYFVSVRRGTSLYLST